MALDLKEIQELPPLASPPPPPAPPAGDLREAKRRRLLAVTSSPRLAPASPAPSAYSDPEVLDWWCPAQVHSDSPVLLAIHEMQKYLEEWEASSKDVFWQRKSNKAVLSILLCRSEDGDWCTYHGMNTEVSLPSGSVCAERAAIVRAASDFRHAKDITVIATLDPSDKLNPLWPCEVCQSWLSKLRQENPDMMVVAFSSVECKRFAIRVNGELVEPPKQQMLVSPSPNEAITGSPWPDLVELAEGMQEYPWDCKDVVYVDGAWNFFHAGHQRILKEGSLRGSHVLVGIHSDQLLNDLFGKPSHENFETRFGRIMQSRFVSFVLKDAPWVVPQDLIQTLCIKKVITGSVDKVTDCGKVLIDELSYDPYKVPRELGLLDVINSRDSITETIMQEEHKTRALQQVNSG